VSGADSTIRVHILGDAKGLSATLKQGEKSVGGFDASARKLVGGIGIAVAADKFLDFANDALGEADRLGDATERLGLQLGDLSPPLEAAAGGFAKLGQSKQDVLELEAAFADIATTAQVGEPAIAGFADEAAATAAAVALLGDQDAATVIDLIGKAGAGSEKAMRALGISVTNTEVVARALADTGKSTADSLTEGELAGARYALVLDALKPKLDAVAEGSADVEQRQSELQARWETLTGSIGAGIEGPLTDLLGWILAGIDGFDKLGAHIDATGDRMVILEAAAKGLIDVLQAVLTLLGSIPQGIGDALNIPRLPLQGGGFAQGSLDRPTNVTLNVQPRDSADTERAVIDAIRTYDSRNGGGIL
jgi:hypothetical protein